MPKVSVIIPTYNRAHLLPRAIKSVLNQTFKDFELIIVDDGSTDNTREVVEKFQKQDKRIKYFWQENSGGPSAPLNLGISRSRGLYIAFLGSDDECLPTWLEKQMKLFDSSEPKKPDVVSCNVMIVNHYGIKVTEVSKPRSKEFDDIVANIFLPHVTVGNIFVDRNVFKKIGGFDEKLIIHEDMDMWLRLAKAGFRFDFVYEPLYINHLHENQITVLITNRERIKSIEYFLEKHKDIFSKYPKGLAKMMRNLGTAYFLAGQKEKGRKYFLKAIRLHPRNIRNYINLILSLLGSRLFDFILKFKQRFPFI